MKEYRCYFLLTENIDNMHHISTVVLLVDLFVFFYYTCCLKFYVKVILTMFCLIKNLAFYSIAALVNKSLVFSI